MQQIKQDRKISKKKKVIFGEEKDDDRWIRPKGHGTGTQADDLPLALSLSASLFRLFLFVGLRKAATWFHKQRQLLVEFSFDCCTLVFFFSFLFFLSFHSLRPKFFYRV